MRLRHFCLAIAILPAATPAWAAETIQSGLFRGRPVTYHNVDGRKIFEGDILLDHVAALPVAGTRHLAPGIGVAYTQYLWPTGPQGVAEIPYIITNAADQLSAALSQFNSTFAGVIQFVPRGSQTDYVNFDFYSSGSAGPCESSVGRVGGPQVVTGPSGCTLGTLLHEMGHVTGLYHEMTRPDRDNFITIDTGNVIKGSEDNFTQQGDNAQELALFDYASVMMYIPYAFSRNGGPVLETLPAGMKLSNLTGYTAADIDSVRRLYGAPSTQITIASNPPGLSVSVDGATVTTPQSYAWALNSKHTLSVGTNAQTLNGGTYTYGRWNDNAAASHGIKIVPGNNIPSQPNTAPAVTVYTANFVQLSSYTAASTPSGAGNVAISPAPQSYPGASGVFLPARTPVSLNATSSGNYQFVTWGGISLPLSQNPKPDYVPDGAAPYDVTASFSTQPITTITTTSPEFYFLIDNTYYFKGPQNFTADLFPGWQAGSKHVVTGFSPTEPYSLNTRFVFDNWSDGGKLSHTYKVPNGASTLTGNFTAQYLPITYAQPACAAAVTIKPKSADGFYNAGTLATVKAASNNIGLVASGWIGDLSGKKTSQALTISDEELAVATYNTTTQPFAVTTLTPDLMVSGSAGGTVKIKGTGFAPGSAVFVNNTYRTATYVSSQELDIALTSADLMTATPFPIGVSNYPANGSCGNYAALTFLVARP